MPRTGRRTLALMLLGAMLSGCNTVEHARQERQQQDLAQAHQSCTAAGIVDGTPEFTQCLETESTRIADRRRRTFEQSEQRSLPIYVQPSVPSGRLCLPTAAGAGGPSYTCI